jgi:putative transposase
VVTPAARRQAAQYAQQTHELSQRRSGRLIGIGNSSLRYHSRRPDDADLRVRLRALAVERPRFGYRRLGVMLEREGMAMNHKRVRITKTVSIFVCVGREHNCALDNLQGQYCTVQPLLY